jgi:hypothetical protein
MSYDVEFGLGALIHIPSFINWFTHSKVDRKGIYSTQAEVDVIRRLYFIKIKKSGKTGRRTCAKIQQWY